jgi:ubiquinone/menaquinone biosynthesis C-methylase UbiE
MTNPDPDTVKGFGAEWTAFDQSSLAETEAQAIFDEYFSLFPWDSLPDGAVGFDLGCGSGRWAKLVAPRVGQLHCIDASAVALNVARVNLARHSNCHFHAASVEAMPIADSSMDFGYSLGVLHHVPDTQGGIAACVAKLKPGAPFLLYLYYALDGRSRTVRLMWRLSDLARRGISRTPHPARLVVTAVLAAGIYVPLAYLSRTAERVGVRVEGFPLSAYRHRSFYTMRTDAYDRFSTRLEQRFRREAVEQMMRAAGLERISFRDAAPFWCSVGYRRR